MSGLWFAWHPVRIGARVHDPDTRHRAWLRWVWRQECLGFVLYLDPWEVHE